MQSVTVKVPSRWKVDSQHAQVWLRDYFVHPVALPDDPGAGDRVVCLSLNERQTAALARGLGEPRAVALRRLLAAHVQELPPAPGAIVSAKREGPKSVQRGTMNSEQAYVAGLSSTRQINGQQFIDITEDSSARPVRTSVQVSALSNLAVPEPSKLAAVVHGIFSMAIYIVPIVAVILFFGGGFGGAAAAAASTEVFPTWRPE